MSQNNTWTLTVTDRDGRNIDTDMFINDLETIVEYNPLEDSCSWYDPDNDITALSKLHPEYVFRLVCACECPEYSWVGYAINGNYWEASCWHEPTLAEIQAEMMTRRIECL